MNELIKECIYYVSTIFLNIFLNYFTYNLIGKKYKIFEIKNIIWIIVLTIGETLLNIYCPQPFKFIINTLLLITMVYSISKNIKNTCIIIILLEVSLSILEVIIMGLLSVLSLDYQRTEIINPLSNILVATLGTIILNKEIIKRIFEKISNFIESIKQKEIIIHTIIVLLIILISTAESYMNLPTIIILISNTIMAVIIIYIIIKYITTKNNYRNISNKYQTSITSLKEYEDMIEKSRISNHENKNELLTIRNIVRKNKKAVDYIDNLIGNKIKDNEKIMRQTLKIPEGGLRATIYAKLCTMDKYGIKHNLQIAKNVKTIDLINLSDNVNMNICKILGVFLDNSIEAVKDLEKKIINIELYVIDNNLYIDITNNFSGNLEIDKISKGKYSTKGKGHGYGLLLVDKIIRENNKILSNNRSIIGDTFTQNLIIKM